MPRAKPNGAPPYFEIEPYKLSADVEAELVNLLGFDAVVPTEKEKIQKATNRIEHYVGRYLAIAELDKHLPGNASLIAELKSFVKRSEFSKAAFMGLYPWLQQKFQQRGINLSLEEQESEKVIRIAEDIIESLSGENRGKRVNRPFKDLIAQLRKIFRGFRTNELDDSSEFTDDELENLMHMLNTLDSDPEPDNKKRPADIDKSVRRYQSEAGLGQDSRHKSGSMQALSEAEYDEYEFVTFVLKAADISVPKNLLDLFKHVGRPTGERADVLNRLAKRAKKRRQSRT